MAPSTRPSTAVARTRRRGAGWRLRVADGDRQVRHLGLLRAIHRHLFGDVYAWAGEYRRVNLRKSVGRDFADVGTGEIDAYLGDVHRLVVATGWDRLERAEFVEACAEVFAHLNQAHPFREGNGRTSKMFMEYVAELSPFAFDFGRVTPDEWNQGSMLSAPDLYSYAPVPGSLLPVFDAVVVPRPAARAERAVSPGD
ncbi:MAG: Fic/DOC family protein [Sporichthyaceae bacterium]